MAARGVVILVAAFLMGACGDAEMVPRDALTTQAEGHERAPDQVIESGTYTATREGVKKAVMEARRISFFNLDGKVEADSIRLTFFDRNGVAESRLNARFGEIDQRTDDMLARGQVLVLADDGSRIEGEELRYDAARDLFVSTQPVTIFQHGNRIRGAGMESDPALRNIRITGTTAVLESLPRVGREARPAAAPPPGAAPVPPAPAGAAPAGMPTSPPAAPPTVAPGALPSDSAPTGGPPSTPPGGG